MGQKCFRQQYGRGDRNRVIRQVETTHGATFCEPHRPCAGFMPKMFTMTTPASTMKNAIAAKILVPPDVLVVLLFISSRRF